MHSLGAIVQISLTEASAELVSLVEAALLGEEIVILKDNQPVMKLTRLEPIQKRRPAKAGSAKGRVADHTLQVEPDIRQKK